MQGWLWGWGGGLILSHLWLRVDGLILLSVAVRSWNLGQAQDSWPREGMSPKCQTQQKGFFKED